MRWLGIIVAGFGVLAHVWFAYREILGWKLEFVKKVAPSWVEGLDEKGAQDRVDWASQLAANVAYNLVLAVGLAWTCWGFFTRSSLTYQLGLFFGFWLLVAAIAAARTEVFLAAGLQGALGVFLLIASFGISSVR
jgi:uncharacterized membrane protein